MPRFSEAFGIAIGPDDDWFDPILERDTPLFIDPFLVSADSLPFWVDAYGGLIGFFNEALKLVATSGGVYSSASWRKAESMLRFPEPAEFALGLGQDTIFGAGMGTKIRDAMLESSYLAIKAGLNRVENLEELMLLGEAVGPDRISDLVCNILKSHFIRYTQAVANRHDLPTERLPLRNAAWSTEDLRWVDGYVELPRNPIWTPATAVLLTPHRFLRELPTVDAEDFWDWAWLTYSEQLKQDFNYQIAKSVDRREIVRLAKSRRAMWLEYLRTRPRRPYDFERDPHNLTIPYDLPPKLASYLIPATPESSTEFCDFVLDLLEKFKWTIEEKRGWEALWAGENSRPERICQVLLSQTLLLACRSANVDMSREVETGRGPVDFKFSTGWDARALLELKLAHSSSLRPNVRFQVPLYLRAEDVVCGFMVVIQFVDSDVGAGLVDWITSETSRISLEIGRRYEPVFVDARRDRSSASRQR